MLWRRTCVRAAARAMKLLPVPEAKNGQPRHQPRTPMSRRSKPDWRASGMERFRVRRVGNEGNPNAKIEHGAHLLIGYLTEGLDLAKDRRDGPVEGEPGGELRRDDPLEVSV